MQLSLSRAVDDRARFGWLAFLRIEFESVANCRQGRHSSFNPPDSDGFGKSNKVVLLPISTGSVVSFGYQETALQNKTLQSALTPRVASLPPSLPKAVPREFSTESKNWRLRWDGGVREMR